MRDPVQTKQEVLRVLRGKRRQIRALGVRRLGLFGSFVRGEPHVQSDVDILVEFQPRSKTFDNFLSLALLLEDALQRRVELVTPESLSPHVGPHILQEVEYAALAP